MDIKQIQAAISEMKSLNLRGNEYTQVQQRIEAFRRYVGFEFAIESELIEDNESRVLIKAVITDRNGFVVASGHAEELRGSSNVNRTSAVENCETSAWGRALANLGLHGGKMASAEEIDTAKHNGAVRDQRQAPAPAPGIEQIPFPSNDKVTDWRLWVDEQKNNINKMNVRWHLQSWAKKTSAEREALQEYDRELTAELKDHYGQRYEQLNDGVR